MNDECKYEVLEELGISLEPRKKGGKRSMVLGLLFGSLIGAGWAFLSAPYSGPQTREMLREKGVELRDRAQTVVEETKDRTQTMVEETRNRAQDVTRTAKDRVNELSQRGAEVVTQKVADLQGKVSELREGISSNTAYAIDDQGQSTALAQPMDNTSLPSGKGQQVRPSGETTSP